MFLDVLQERNKEMFLKACVSAAAPDRSLTEKEKEALQVCCRRLGVAEHIPQSSDDVAGIIARMAAQADVPERRAMALGILAFVRIGGCTDGKSGLIDGLAEGLEIGKDTAYRLDFLLELCASASREMRRTVFGWGIT